VNDSGPGADSRQEHPRCATRGSGDLAATEEGREAPVPSEAYESIPPISVQPEAPKHLSSVEAIRILDEVTGINVRIGEIVVAELGLQMERFPDEAHLSSWVGLCPAAKISANKRLSTKTGKGNRWLRQALIEAASAAARESRHLSRCLLPATAQAHGTQESDCGPGSSHPGHHLSSAQRATTLSGAGAGPCRRVRQTSGTSHVGAPGL